MSSSQQALMSVRSGQTRCKVLLTTQPVCGFSRLLTPLVLASGYHDGCLCACGISWQLHKWHSSPNTPGLNTHLGVLSEEPSTLNLIREMSFGLPFWNTETPTWTNIGRLDFVLFAFEFDWGTSKTEKSLMHSLESKYTFVLLLK